MSSLGSLIVAVLAVVSGACLLGLHDLSADQFLAILAGAGIHVSSVSIPKLAAGSSSAGAGAAPPSSG